jgi:hypothetical protein
VFGIALVLAVAASAAATRVVTWHLLARGLASKSDGETPIGILAPSRNAAQRLVLRVPPQAADTVLRLDYRRRAALGIFGPFGCRDGRVRIIRIEQIAALLRVRLAMQPLGAGKVECLAIYPTFRLVALDRGDLGPRLPTRVAVTVAGT